MLWLSFLDHSCLWTRTHTSLAAPVSASLFSCAASSGRRPCLSPAPAPPGWTGSRSPGRDWGSDPGSRPPPGRRTGIWEFHFLLPASPVWGSRRRASCLRASRFLRCRLVIWMAGTARGNCCKRSRSPWWIRSSRPAGETGRRRVKC